MISKKTLAVTALALLLSQQSFASETEGFYFGGGHYGQYLNLGKLKVKAGDKDAKDVLFNDRSAANTDNQPEYKGDYNPPFAANVTFGYTGELGNNSYRAELEGMYSSVKVDNVGLTSGQMVVSYKEDNNEYRSIINHDQIGGPSVMANVYHYWKSDRFSFSPYVGIGVGGTRMTMFEKTSMRPAAQLKAGLDYRINEDVNMHIGYRGFGVIGSSECKLETFKWDPKVDSGVGKKKGAAVKSPMVTTIQNSFFHTHGIEVGLTFRFAGKA